MMKTNHTRTHFGKAVSVFILALAFVTGSSLIATAAPLPQAAQQSTKNEAYISKEVHHELVMLPWLSIFDNLEYKVEGGKVTLMGQVVKPSTKDDAGNVVKHIEGVDAVDNQIDVLPPSPMDDGIRRTEFRAIYGYPSLSRYSFGALSPIHIIVKNGHVTLEGVVDNQGDKDIAGLRANTVPNVFSVTNNLRVENGK
jgi:hyperosmotically inducible periplasmic protein